MNSHRRQNSNDNFMTLTKLMEDEVMVPSKLKDKNLDNTTPVNSDSENSSDVLDHYKFIRLIRNQFLHSKPFANMEDYNNNELKNKKFKQTFDSLSYHYTELMHGLENLSHEAKAITDLYRSNV